MAVTFGTITLLLLAIRVGFASLFPNNWIASFIPMAIISVTLLILSKKDRLGWWGKAFLRQVQKNQKGKRALFFYGEAIFLIGLLSMSIYAINLGNDSHLESVKKDMILHVPALRDKTVLDNEIKNTAPIDLVKEILAGLLVMPIVIITEFPKFAALLSAMNDEYHGWVLNLYSISLVEYCEIFGMLVFYRITLGKKSGMLTNMANMAQTDEVKELFKGMSESEIISKATTDKECEKSCMENRPCYACSMCSRKITKHSLEDIAQMNVQEEISNIVQKRAETIPKNLYGIFAECCRNNIDVSPMSINDEGLKTYQCRQCHRIFYNKPPKHEAQ